MQTCPTCGEQNSDTAKFCQECATPLRSQPALPQEARKTVIVLFCDLVGSTALGERLDSESLREVMDRYFTEMKRIVERHGGIVEKYMGDAVMAVFGLPRAHEDDALRAVRAAFEMGQSLATLNSELDRYWGVALVNRIGVTTGEVVVGDIMSGQRLATGDTVNVAARLEQAALAGGVLVGEPTYQLVRDAVEVQAIEPLALKGKSERLPAFRLLNVKRGAEGISRRPDALLVGRDEEISQLMDTFERVVVDRAVGLVTVLGEAGVGKSRLVAEIANRLQLRATILTGRCLSYGEGNTFWPLAEIVRRAAAIADDDSIEAARHKLADALEGEDDGIANRVASLIGLPSDSYPLEEGFWAARKLLENLARKRPLVVSFEDIHWAETTFLNFIEHVATLAENAPILLICSARPDLLEEHPDWSREYANASRMTVEPLSSSESRTLINDLLGTAAGEEVRSRLTQAAQGNPLFLEQIVSMWMDDGTLRRDHERWLLPGDASISIPPTISALLSARLDRLAQEERVVIGGASVVGGVFYRGAVQELCPTSLMEHVPISLSILTRKEFIRAAEASDFVGEDTFAFRHILIRDTVYEAILKKTRAQLHERFASWLERAASERVSEYEEIIGHHLEQAFHFRVALTAADEHAKGLGERAAERLAAAGKRASARGDVQTATGLLERATALLPRLDPKRVELQFDLVRALDQAGAFGRAEEIASVALEAATELGDRRLQARARLQHIEVAMRGGADVTQEDIKELIAVLEQEKDDAALAFGWYVLGQHQGEFTQDATASFETSATYAERVGDTHQIILSLGFLAGSLAETRTPVDIALERCGEIRDRMGDSKWGETGVLWSEARLLAMLGRFKEASERFDRGAGTLHELGLRNLELLSPNSPAVFIACLSEEWASAKQHLLHRLEIAREWKERRAIAELSAELAQVTYSLGELGEAERFARASKEAAGADGWNMIAQGALAKVLARRGDFERAISLASEAVDVARTLDSPNFRGGALLDLTEVLSLANRQDDAVPLVEEALHLYEQKGNIVSATKARKLLEELSRGTSSRSR